MATSSSPPPLDPQPTNGTVPQQQNATAEDPNGAAPTNGEAPELPREQPSKETQMQDMEDNYKTGRSLYLANNYEAAADRLSYATQLGVKLYGEFAPECFNSYLYYGKTLVELSREDSLAHVLKPPSVQDEASDSDGDDEEETENGEPEEEGGGKGGQGGTRGVTGYLEPLENVDAGSEDLENGAQNGTNGESSEVPTNGEHQHVETAAGTDSEGEENASLAWEVLEVARAICEKYVARKLEVELSLSFRQNESQEWKLNKSEVHAALGDALTVREEFDQARVELMNAHRIQMELLEPHDRKLAETLFSIGLTHRSQTNFTNAAEYFEKAAEVLKKKIDYLKTELESGTLNDEDAKTATAELEDARAVAESIMAEIADARDSAETQKKMKEFMREESQRLEQSGQGTLAGGSGGGEQTVDDLTAFVRKRKHPDTSEPQNNENGSSVKVHEGDSGETISEAGESGENKKARLEEENAPR
ncbi:nuclear autoantigenic sperm protein [Aphelenchoides avenae]|nr:nuclear autoantigenic sperm protein [Aphelenchus avenae]